MSQVQDQVLERNRITTRFMIVTVAGGSVLFGLSLLNLPYRTLDLLFLVVFVCTIGFGSRITVRIPKLRSHVAVSDTFVFLTLILYGGEAAVVLAAVEAFFSSRRFCSRQLTVYFNAAAMAISTSFVVAVLQITGYISDGQFLGRDGKLADVIIALSLMAIVQFILNTSLASVYDSIKDGLALWDNWKTKYLWTFVTYFVGAACAGALVQILDFAGIGVIFAVLPLIFLVFMTYRMYLQNVEMSIAQAERAEQYARDIEERSLALRESEERFRSAFDHAPIGIALITNSGKWLKVNRALCRLLGYSETELKNLSFQQVVYPEDIGPAMARFNEVLCGRSASAEMEQRYVNSSGKTVWTWTSASTSGERPDGTTDLILQIQDITDRKLAEEKLQRDATHDALTGLPNRSLFMKRLTEALQERGNNERYRISVLFIDLDRFKYVNDSLGHIVGDELLVRISTRIRDCLRPSDVVARIGGDEFTILVEGEHDLVEVTRIAERIQKEFTSPFEIKENIIYSSASIGVLHASEKHSTSEEMMRDADTAMYHAKRTGKARHEIFDENMHKEARETLRLETDLRRAIERNELSVLYQPIFSLRSNDVYCLEALARWEHPELGEVPPARFIKLAEEIGWIEMLGEQVLRRACTEISSLYKQVDGPPPQLSVNLSCRQFASADLPDTVLRILEETDFPSPLLRLEITESVFFEYPDSAVEMLEQLRKTGIEIDIDDFGTGYSNLSYLIRLPIATLKIDRSFVSPIKEMGTNTEIVRTIIDLAKNLGLSVVAEGIETEAQLETLRSLSCDYGQGFFLARPMGISDIQEFLSGKREHLGPSSASEIAVLPTLQ